MSRLDAKAKSADSAGFRKLRKLAQCSTVPRHHDPSWKSGASAPRKQFEINERFSACAVEMDTQRVFLQPLSAMPGSSQFGQRASVRQNQLFPIELPISCRLTARLKLCPSNRAFYSVARSPDLGFCDHMRRSAIACLSAASAVIDLRSRAPKKRPARRSTHGPACESASANLVPRRVNLRPARPEPACLDEVAALRSYECSLIVDCVERVLG